MLCFCFCLWFISIGSSVFSGYFVWLVASASFLSVCNLVSRVNSCVILEERHIRFNLRYMSSSDQKSLVGSHSPSTGHRSGHLMGIRVGWVTSYP
jgi:hypothetical protein